MLEAHLDERPYLVGGSCSIADLANFAYAHVAEDAGLRLSEYPSVSAWLDRVRALPDFVDDLLPYPDNARPPASRSIYDA
jgi:glutathione S-transferase